ncbi:MAG TPA: SCP2 sterol-binding domain-containing protein [Caldilineaceae bacterium]|nr:SCP2 sterol-binding domain-containing protein [Caldilineaceae bacterium]
MLEINQSAGYAEAAKTWEGDVLMVVTGHGAHYLDLWHGQCRSALYLVDFGSQKAEFSLSAALNTWQHVLIGKLDPMQGMMKGQLKLEGNLIKVMQHMKAAQEMMLCAARVETEF